MKKTIVILFFLLVLPMVGNAQVLLGFPYEIRAWKYGANGETDKSITSFRIPSESFEGIESNAFSGFKNLRDVYIPKNIVRIAMPIFSDCPSVERIEVDSDNEYFTSIDGVLFNKDTTELICFPPAKSVENYIMPKSVKLIDKSAFNSCTRLEKITIPGSVKSIPDFAFEHFENLKSVEIMDGVNTIGKRAFAYCSSLDSVVIPKSIKKIGSEAFCFCDKLHTVTLANGSCDIDDDVFQKCLNLKSVRISNGVDSITQPIFKSFSNYELFGDKKISNNISIFLPASVKYITNVSGWHGYNIDTIHVDSGNTNFLSIDGALYNADKTVLLRFLGNINKYSIPKSVHTIEDYAFKSSPKQNYHRKKFIIPGNVKTIGNYSFEDAPIYYSIKLKLKKGVERIGDYAFWFSEFQSILFPSSLKEIGSHSFYCCDGVKSITIPGNVKKIGTSSFGSCYNLKKVTIKDGVEIIGWNAFQGSDSLRAVVIPKSIKKIGSRAFSPNTSISSPDTSSRMKLWLFKVRSDANREIGRHDSVQYYDAKIKDLLQTIHCTENDYSSIFISSMEYYKKLSDFAQMKYYCQEGINHVTQLLPDTAQYDLGCFLLYLADACLCLKQYHEADSVLKVFEDLHNFERTTNTFAGGIYPYLVLKMYYELNDIESLKKYIRNNYYELRDETRDYWLKTHVLLFNDISPWYFETYYKKRCSSSTIGDCYYFYCQHPYYSKYSGFADSAFVYYSKSFNEEFKKLKESFSYMNVYQRQYYWEEHKASFDNVVNISTKLPDKDSSLRLAYNSLLVSKGLLLSSEQNLANIIQNTKDEKLINDYYKLNLYRTQIDTIKDPIQKEQLITLATLLETNLMQRSSQFADVTNYMSVDWKNVRDSLNTNDVAIEFFFNNDSLYALVLKRSFVSPKLLSLGGFAKNENAYYSTTEVYNSVWKPLEQYMSENGNTYFSPSGALYNIAIEYATIDTTHIISDKYKIYRISSTRNLALAKTKPNPNKKAATYGGIQYNFGPGNWADRKDKEYDSYVSDLVAFRDVPDLENTTLRTGVQNLIGTKIEAQQITEILRNSGYQVSENNDIYATEESFKKLSGSGLTLLHIATHGFYQPKDTVVNNSYEKEDISLSQSGLLFAGANSAIDPQKRKEIPEGFDDGILTAKEISRMDLKGLDLVVLSACQTGLGEVTSEGVFGLQRGFKKAGANTIVMSLWKVDDNATKLLMTEFFKNLTLGLSKRESFFAAQKIVRTKYHDPFYWAAFVMVDGEFRDDYDIYNYIYKGDKSITEYAIPDGVKVIGKEAFMNCENLESITIPESVTEIGESAFELCTNLKTVFIPKNVREIKGCAFSSCYSLQGFEVDKDNPYFSTIYGALFSHDKTKLISYPNKNEYSIPNGTKIIGLYSFQGCKDMISVTVPNSVEIIEEGAFSICNGLTSITIPNSVKTIGEFAFQKCGNLQNVTIENGVEHIGQYAFSKCNSLTSLSIPNSVKEIDTCAFWKSENLKTVNLPDGITEIKKSTFQECKNLESITIPNSVKEIGESAFLNCENLVTMHISNGVEKIGSSAFRLCNNLSSITIPASVKTIGEYAFQKCGNLQNVTIENGVEHIGQYAFSICNSLSEIIIPGSVKSIGEYAFWKSENLQTVKIEGGVKTIKKNVFEECNNLKNLIMPDGLKMD